MWIQISAGRGPLECGRAAWHLLGALEREMVLNGRTVELLDAVEWTRGAVRSALLRLEGDPPEDFPDTGEGTVLWVCPSPDRPGHGRKNWFVDVALLPEPTREEHDLARCRVDTMRSSGAGGQNVNKVETAVRITHLDTGIVVVASEERSQARNRSLALARLRERLADLDRSRSRDAASGRWKRHDDLVRGAPFRVYEGPGFRRRP